MWGLFQTSAYLFTDLDLSYRDGLNIWFIFFLSRPGEDNHDIWVTRMVHQGRNRGDGASHGREGRR